MGIDATVQLLVSGAVQFEFDINTKSTTYKVNSILEGLRNLPEDSLLFNDTTLSSSDICEIVKGLLLIDNYYAMKFIELLHESDVHNNYTITYWCG